MSGRPLLALVMGLVIAGSVLATGCSTSNSATVTSTPTPASTLPFETPTHSPSPTVTPTPSSSASPTPSGASTPTPSKLARPVSTYALVRGLGKDDDGSYTITYDPVVVCAKAAVKANESPKECKPKPAKTASDGSWMVRTTKTSVMATLSPTVSGKLYPAGVSFDVTAKNLAKQPVRKGRIFDWSTVTVPALLTVDKNEITTVAGAQPGN